MFYNGLRSSIPRRWLDLLAITNNIDKFIVEKPQSLIIKLNDKYLELRKVTCRQFYWGEIKIISERPTCYFKWESVYFFADFDWDLINIIPYEYTSDTYLQSIHYKIIHRYFPCKYQLNTWNTEDSNNCTYCQEIDTLSHAACQLQEKCREQHRDLYTTFIDLTKAFDTVSRAGLWKIMAKFGCPDKFIALVRSFHDGMQVRVQENGESS